MSSGVRFDGPANSPEAYLKADVPLPCNVCAHDIRDHQYLYTLTAKNLDVYRCKKRNCNCGQKSEVRGMTLAGNPTEADVAAAMESLGAGGGLPIDPRFLR